MIPVPDGKIDLARLSNLEPAQYVGYDKDVHLVVKGDNLTKISLMYGTNTNKLLKLNGMSAKQYIYPGDRIILREQTDADKDGKASKTLVIYTVEKGDTLGEISSRLGIGVKDIAKWNGIYTLERIYPGDKLKIWR